MCNSTAVELDHAGRVEPGDRLMRIAPRIAHHVGSVQLEIGHAMGVAEDPQRNAVAAHQLGHVARERTGERPQRRRRRTGADQRCVVGDDHRRARMAVAEPLLEPAAAGQVSWRVLSRVSGRPPEPNSI